MTRKFWIIEINITPDEWSIKIGRLKITILLVQNGKQDETHRRIGKK